MDEIEELLQVVEGSLGESVPIDTNALLHRLNTVKGNLLRPLQAAVSPVLPSYRN